MKTVIIIDLIVILIVAFFIGEIIKHITNTKETFISPSNIVKKCNRIKRKSKARIYNIKNNLERNVRDKIDASYKLSKNLFRKILFPKEIKISF